MGTKPHCNPSTTSSSALYALLLSFVRLLSCQPSYTVAYMAGKNDLGPCFGKNSLPLSFFLSTLFIIREDIS